MNSFGKILAITLAGVIGGTIGYFVSNLIIYKLEENYFSEDSIEPEEEEEVENDEEEVQMLPTFSETRTPKNYSTSKSSLDSLASKYTTPEASEREEPYLLTEEEYQNDNGSYHQEALIYWALDEQLTDSAYNLIENPKKMIGSTTLTKFGFVKSDPDILYVRDDKKHRDYEISKVEKAYGVEIRGDDDPDEEPPKVNKKKPKVRKMHNEDGDDE